MPPERTSCVGSHPCQGYRRTSCNGWDWMLLSMGSLKFRQLEIDGANGEYHSKYNPIERCWGILELKWNGAKLLDVETMLGWAKKMTWKGIHPVVELSRQVYTKGI